ncbi:hypothetical protein EVAR_94990_1 [Eumeta japonica]|uniref:Uncharacterized protein n=1 Tax=Eumeta variegata TaxID=151549 RepID=A0A4C1UUN2_EUMVA|nr:hypothetical protein EVAR_94990_1 [Eumeta japonica]
MKQSADHKSATKTVEKPSTKLTPKKRSSGHDISGEREDTINKTELDNVLYKNVKALRTIGLEALIELHSQISATVQAYSRTHDRTKLPSEILALVNRYTQHLAKKFKYSVWLTLDVCGGIESVGLFEEFELVNPAAIILGNGVDVWTATSSGCSSVAIGRLRFSPLDHPFSLVCYCVSVYLRAAFRSVELRACTIVGVPRSVSRATAVKPRASVPATSSGYPAVCTPSPHTVSAPRERSRSFRTPDTDSYFSYFACFYARKWFFH